MRWRERERESERKREREMESEMEREWVSKRRINHGMNTDYGRQKKILITLGAMTSTCTL